ncbi:copper chaperone PCu(A)C [Porphyrobacter algicida]|uniref:Copper chaperone PCu(A)C n=1 Tax=Qipengyuania algicida TaxID=1836209 RepID=A0A845AHZ6_9SPHN|nr:copper chaperone PCu(A)C [Qipengyuania algicida]MXP28445.1 copper chaperone PCu(A)C [Qipengyuania algicida]
MKKYLAAICLATAGITLAACSGTADTQKTAEDANPTGLEITNARLLLPPVKGNPAAIYFTVKNTGKRNVAIRSASVKDAKSAQLHDMMEYDFKQTMGEMPPLMLQPGASVDFKPGGKHVMVYDLSPTIKVGDSTEMTLTIAGGDSITTKVPVMAADTDR